MHLKNAIHENLTNQPQTLEYDFSHQIWTLHKHLLNVKMMYNYFKCALKYSRYNSILKKILFQTFLIQKNYIPKLKAGTDNNDYSSFFLMKKLSAWKSRI